MIFEKAPTRRSSPDLIRGLYLGLWQVLGQSLHRSVLKIPDQARDTALGAMYGGVLFG